jgi:hypothetical protein
MLPLSLPELTALQKITAQKGITDRATVMAAQCGTGFNRNINPFEHVRQDLQ